MLCQVGSREVVSSSLQHCHAFQCCTMSYHRLKFSVLSEDVLPLSVLLPMHVKIWGLLFTRSSMKLIKPAFILYFVHVYVGTDWEQTGLRKPAPADKVSSSHLSQSHSDLSSPFRLPEWLISPVLSSITVFSFPVFLVPAGRSPL